MKTIFFSGILNPMSNNEMKNVRAGEANGLEAETEVSDVVNGATSCDKITPCKGQNLKVSCKYLCNGQALSGRCCNSGGLSTMHCSDLGDFGC